MSSYFIVSVNIDRDDRSLYDDYILKVKPIVERYGGEYLVRTEEIIPLSKEWQPDRIIIIKFLDREQLNKCFSSPEYKAIQDLRIKSVDARAIIANGLE